jgi:hypothetical protein
MVTLSSCVVLAFVSLVLMALAAREIAKPAISPVSAKLDIPAAILVSPLFFITASNLRGPQANYIPMPI